MYSLTNNPESTKANLNFFTVKDALSDYDIEYLNKFGEKVKLEKAGIDGKETAHNVEGLNLKIRNSSIFWIKPESESERMKNIFRNITSKIIEINETVYEFDLTDIEPIQYTRYYEGDFYRSHIDMEDVFLMANTCRKLSFSIQLTDPSEYDGGELRRASFEGNMTACKEKGSMTLFPSFTLHEVTSVTRGTRNALVGWCWGPKFK